MDIIYSLIIVALSAIVQASFQLSISTLTLLSSHSLGAKRSQIKLLKLTSSFMVGAIIMTFLLIADAILVLVSIYKGAPTQLIWTIACGLNIGVGLSVWLFYFQPGGGTSLWVPRPFAHYLTERTKSTRSGAEAFSLGLSSVFGELLFICAPILMAAVIISTLPTIWQFTSIGLYGLISLSSLGIVWVLISSGHKISRIQKWREDNKRFLQFSAGAGLVIIALFVFINEVMTSYVAGV